MGTTPYVPEGGLRERGQKERRNLNGKVIEWLKNKFCQPKTTTSGSCGKTKTVTTSTEEPVTAGLERSKNGVFREKTGRRRGFKGSLKKSSWNGTDWKRRRVRGKHRSWNEKRKQKKLL